MHLGIEFSWILVDFERQVGRETAAKIDPKRHRKTMQKRRATGLSKNPLKCHTPPKEPREEAFFVISRWGPALDLKITTFSDPKSSGPRIFQIHFWNINKSFSNLKFRLDFYNHVYCYLIVSFSFFFKIWFVSYQWDKKYI